MPDPIGYRARTFTPCTFQSFKRNLFIISHF